jgi:Cu(I)/Ag(I) efflux system periplasmic protein CusF
MKSISLLIVAALFVTPVAGARAQTNMDTKKADQPAASSAAIHKAAGIVKSADRGKGSVTLAHGAVASLKWPAMTMGFTVRDKALFDKLAPGKTVEFEFAQQGKDYVITGVK